MAIRSRWLLRRDGTEGRRVWQLVSHDGRVLKTVPPAPAGMAEHDPAPGWMETSDFSRVLDEDAKRPRH